MRVSGFLLPLKLLADVTEVQNWDISDPAYKLISLRNSIKYKYFIFHGKRHIITKIYFEANLAYQEAPENTKYKIFSP